MRNIYSQRVGKDKGLHSNMFWQRNHHPKVPTPLEYWLPYELTGKQQQHSKKLSGI
jgi:hypothetical protein